MADGNQGSFKVYNPGSKKYPAVSPATLATLNEQLLALDKLEPHNRGFEFERFLKDLFESHGLAPRCAFRLAGEQIDGSFGFNGAIVMLQC